MRRRPARNGVARSTLGTHPWRMRLRFVGLGSVKVEHIQCRRICHSAYLASRRLWGCHAFTSQELAQAGPLLSCLRPDGGEVSARDLICDGGDTFIHLALEHRVGKGRGKQLCTNSYLVRYHVFFTRVTTVKELRCKRDMALSLGDPAG